MPFRVFETDQKGVDLLAQDDLVNRQTLVIKDGAPWSIKGKVVLVDGAEAALNKAEELVRSVGGKVCVKGATIKKDLDAEGDDAASGVGFIFG